MRSFRLNCSFDRVDCELLASALHEYLACVDNEVDSHERAEAMQSDFVSGRRRWRSPNFDPSALGRAVARRQRVVVLLERFRSAVLVRE